MEKISPKLLNQALRLSLKASFYTQGLESLKPNSNQRGKFTINAQKEHQLNWRDKYQNIVIDAQLLIQRGESEYQIKEMVDQNKIGMTQKIQQGQVTLIESQYRMKQPTKILSERTLTDNEWTSFLENTIYEILAQNLNYYTINEVTSIEKLKEQLKTQLKLQTSPHKDAQTIKQPILIDKLNFETQINCPEALVNFMQYFELFQIIFQDENGLSCIQLVHTFDKENFKAETQKEKKVKQSDSSMSSEFDDSIIDSKRNDSYYIQKLKDSIGADAQVNKNYEKPPKNIQMQSDNINKIVKMDMLFKNSYPRVNQSSKYKHGLQRSFADSDSWKENQAQMHRKIQQQQMIELKKKLQESKLFMNMVIHDLRSPTEGIQQGLIQAKQILEREISNTLNMIEQTFNDKILVKKRVSSKSHSRSNCISSSLQNFGPQISSDQVVSSNEFDSSISGFRNKAQMKQKNYYATQLKKSKNHDSGPLQEMGQINENKEKINALQKSFFCKLEQNELMDESKSANISIKDHEEQIPSSYKVADINGALSAEENSLSNRSRNLGCYEEIKFQKSEIENLKFLDEDQKSKNQDSDGKPSLRKIKRMKDEEEKNNGVRFQLQESPPNFTDFDDVKSEDFQEHPEELQAFNENHPDLGSVCINFPKISYSAENSQIMNPRQAANQEVKFVVKYVDKKMNSKDQATQTLSFCQEQEEKKVDDQFLKDYENYKMVVSALEMPIGIALQSQQIEEIIESLKLLKKQKRKNQSQQNLFEYEQSNLNNSFFGPQIEDPSQIYKIQEQQSINNFKNRQSSSLEAFSRPSEFSQEQQQIYLNNLNNSPISGLQLQEQHDPTGLCPRCLSISKFMLQQLSSVCSMINTTVMYIEQSILSSYNLTNLINDLLDLAKLEQATFQLTYQQFNLFELVSELYTIMKYQAAKSNIKLLLEFDTSQPFVFQRLNGDRRRFLQILQNFVSNSLKFTPSGGFVKIQLLILEEQIIQKQLFKKLLNSDVLNQIAQDVQVEQIKGLKRSNSQQTKQKMKDLTADSVDVQKYIKLRIVVEDNGAGVSIENIDKLFQDYAKLQEHENMNAKGTGLGMSICKKIIKQMGGNVYAESQVGQGTKINIELGLQSVDKEYLVSVNDRQNSMTNYQKLQYLRKISALDFSQEFYQLFELETQFKPNPFSAEEQRQHQSKVLTNINAIQLYHQKELFVFNPQEIRNKQEAGSLNKYSERIKKIESSISKYSLAGNIEPLLSSDRQQHPSIASFPRMSGFASYIQKDINGKRQKQSYSQIILQRNNNQILQKSPSQSSVSQEADSIKVKEQIQDQFQINDGPEQVNENQDGLQSPRSKLLAMVQNYKGKKLRILIANDDHFQLLILSTSLSQMECILSIDQANNGKEAVDFVQINEQSQHDGSLYYDLILLDINMPICDGYEACKQITRFYKELYMQNFLMRSVSPDQDDSEISRNNFPCNESHDDQWLRDLKVMYKAYLDSIIESEINPQAEGASDKNSQMGENSKQNQSKIYKQAFVELLKKTHLLALQSRIQPFIFAYSAMINEGVVLKSKKAGFDDCLLSPLTSQKVDYIIMQFIEATCQQIISESLLDTFTDPSQFAQINDMFLGLRDSKNRDNNQQSISADSDQLLEQQVINGSLPLRKLDQSHHQSFQGNVARRGGNFSSIQEDQNEDLISGSNSIHSLQKKKVAMLASDQALNGFQNIPQVAQRQMSQSQRTPINVLRDIKSREPEEEEKVSSLNDPRNTRKYFEESKEYDNIARYKNMEFQ